MYATDPFLFWVFAKAPVIIYRGGEWGGGVSMGMKFFGKDHIFSGETEGETEGGSVVVNRVHRGVM